MRKSSTGKQRSNEGRNVAVMSIIAGSTAGMTSTSICYPFDVLRTKVQQAAMGNKASVGAQQTSSAAPGPWQVLLSTLRTGGVRSLYVGFIVPFGAQAVYKSTVFMTNNISLEAIKKYNARRPTKGSSSTPNLSLLDRYLCGWLGGSVNGILFVTPVEYVRNQLIAREAAAAVATSTDSGTSTAAVYRSKRIGPYQVIRETIAGSNGIRGLWRGWGMTWARDGIGCGVFFVAMHTTSEALEQSFSSSMSPLARSMMSGAVAGVGYWFVSLPLDTIKTWVQTHQANSGWDALTKLIQQNRGDPVQILIRLNRGYQVAYGRGAPSAAITVGTYDYIYRLLKEQ